MLFYQNLQCITNKIDELSIYLNSFEYNINVIAATETWVKNSEEHRLKLKNYKLASCFARSNSLHGGSCIFVHNTLQFKELDHLKQKSIELVIECSAVEILNPKIIIINIYRPPNPANMEEFINTLEDMLVSITDKYTKHIIAFCGDFNLDLQSPFEKDVKLFKDLMN